MRRFRICTLIALVGVVVAAGGCAAHEEDTDSSGGAIATQSGPLASLKKATRTLTEAQKTVAADNERARTETERIGPALTHEQLAAFGKAFNGQKTMVDHLATATKAAADLEEYLTGDETRRSELESLAASSDDAKQLYNAYVALAGTSSSKSALVFAVSVMGTPKAALSKGILSVADATTLEKDVFARALPTVAVMDLAQTSDVDKTMQNLGVLLAPLEKVGATKDIAENLAVLTDMVKRRDLDAIAELASARSREGVQALIASGLSLQLLDLDSNETQAVEVAKKISKVAAMSLSVVAHVTQSFADAAFFAHHSLANSPLQVTSTGLTSLAGRLVPALGLLAGGISLILDLERAQNSPAGAAQFAAVLSIVGDALQIAGCIAQLTVVGAPIGWVLRVVSLAVTALAHAIVDWAENRDRVAEETSCLLTAGLDPTLAKTLANAPPKQLAGLGKDLQFSAEQIQWLATSSPNVVLKSDASGVALDGLVALESAASLTPDDAFAFLQASIVNVDEADRPEALPSLIGVLHGALLPPRVSPSRAGYVSFLTTFADGDVAAHDPATKQVVTDAAAWLDAHATP